MKTRFTRLASLLTMAAIALSGCSKDDAADRTLPEEGAKIKVAANAVIPATRVNVGEYDGAEFPLTWGAGDGLAVVETSQTYGNNGVAVPEFVIATGEGEKTATFTGEIARTEDEYYAVYPHGVLFQSAPDYHDFNLTFPDVQTPTAESLVDPAAVVLVSEAATLGEGGSLDFAFKHVAAYAKMTLKNLGEGKIESVVFAAPNYISGSYYYYYDNSSNHRSPENAYSKKEITIMADNLTVEDGVCEVMFAMLPCTLEKFSVTVNYSDGTAPMKRNCTPATAIEFAEGNVKGFTVDMAKEEPKPDVVTYTKVTSLSDISEGEYVIVATDNQGGYFTLKNDKQTTTPVGYAIADTGLSFDQETISGDAAEYSWEVTGSSSALTIKSTADNTLYLTITASSNTGIRVTNTAITWDAAESSVVTGAFNLGATYSGTKRYLSVWTKASTSTNCDWRSYNSAKDDTTNNQYGHILLFKKSGGTTEVDPTPGTDPEVPTPGDEQTATITFSNDTTTGAYELTQDDVTISVDNGRKDGRVYANAKLTISVISGKNIKEITFEGTDTSNAPKNFSTTVGSFDTSNSTKCVWTGSASSVEFTASKQVRLTKITVVYE